MIEELLQAAKKLVALLEDPHPGIFTWNEAVARQLALLRGEDNA